MSASREVLGPYVILERIGRGGMASVHRAEQQGFGGFTKQVALKRLHPHVAADPAMLRSFVHEARLASHLHHANVAQTYDLGEVDSTYFIAMEYVPGPTLMQVMHQCRDTAGPMPMPIVLSILQQICDALDHAHFLCDDSGKPLGIIHRDVSPSNVIVSNTGIVKLIDFGIAKAANSGVQTQVGYIKGKFGYVAPEYLEGQLDARADLFGVGVIAHELMVGKPLFQGEDDFETLAQVRGMPITPPSHFNREVTPDIDDIVMTALQRDPSLRWQSAGAMRVAIANAARELGIVAGNAQVLEWTQWAFTQGAPAGNKKLARVISMLSEPSTATAQLDTGQIDVLEQLEPQTKTKAIAAGSTGGSSVPDEDAADAVALGAGSAGLQRVRADSEMEVEVEVDAPFGSDIPTTVGEMPELIAATAIGRRTTGPQAADPDSDAPFGNDIATRAEPARRSSATRAAEAAKRPSATRAAEPAKRPSATRAAEPPAPAMPPPVPPGRASASRTAPPVPSPSAPPADPASPAIVVRSAKPQKTMLGVGEPALPSSPARGDDDGAVGAMAAAERAAAAERVAALVAGEGEREVADSVVPAASKRRRRLWVVLIVLALLMAAAGVATYYSLPELGYGTLEP